MSSALVTVTRLRRIAAGALLILLGATWRLWTPGGDLPRIPWLEVLCRVPGGVDIMLLSLLATALLAALLGSGTTRITRSSLGVVTALLAGLILLDQHRLQPWAYHLGLLSLLLAAAPNRVGLACCRAVVVSIYLWSAWSKIDPAFASEHGRMLVEGAARAAGLSTALWSEAQMHLAANLMPAGELAAGLLLAWPRSRRGGVALAGVMHLMLIATLSPWGLGHEPAVLIWNALFIVQNFVLFRGVPATTEPHVPEVEAAEAVDSNVGRNVARGVALAVVLLPALSIGGWFDHWPSWSVYSSRPAVVRVFVRANAVKRLPESLRPWIDAPLALSDWQRVRLEQWSVAIQSVPAYPQARWRLAIAHAVAIQAELLDDAVRVEIESRAGWWSTDRESEVLGGRRELEQALARYWVNTQPRRVDAY